MIGRLGDDKNGVLAGILERGTMGELIEGMLGSDAPQEQYMFLHVQETWPTAADHSDHSDCIALNLRPKGWVQRGARG